MHSACSSSEPRETPQSVQSQDSERRRRLKDTATIAEGIEQDLSNAVIEQAVAEAASGELANLEGDRHKPSCPGGTDCTSWECVPSTNEGARELPSIVSIDARDAYDHAAEGSANQGKRDIYVSVPSPIGQLTSNRLGLIPFPSCSSQSRESSVDNKMTREGAERMYLERQEASASSGGVRESHQAADVLPTRGEGTSPELSSSSSSG